ncbi:TetR/AcrR family transcriptional regulator [Micromonospora zamorensis]|uniref:TetR/AcrR family transcriptional regulator n=1 Tax=Micromonospora zamorensis TaxID=709883 RepID=UPI003CF75E1C
MTTLTHLRVPRPHRADAARNYDAILTEARAAFVEQADTSMEEIARRAGVGIATLYRNFPTRQILVENLYISEVEAVCEAAEALTGRDPRDALFTWLERFVQYIGAKQPLTTALNRGSVAYQQCRQALYSSGGPLLDQAQQAGAVRPDATIDDVMRLASAIASGDFPAAGQREHVLAIALAGLRTPSAQP